MYGSARGHLANTQAANTIRSGWGSIVVTAIGKSGNMVKTAIVAIIGFCTRYAYATIAVSVLLAAASGYYSVKNFAINTDINTLISEDLPWRQRELNFEKSIPGQDDNILVVVDAPTPELAALASSALADKLSNNKELFPSVTQLAGTPFFAQNGLLFRSKEEVGAITRQLATAAPLVRVPVVDPSLRGLNQMIAFVLAGVREHELTLDDAVRPFAMATAALERVLAGLPATFSWQELVSGTPTAPSDLRRLIDVRPRLDFTALEPGKEATDAIRAAAAYSVAGVAIVSDHPCRCGRPVHRPVDHRHGWIGPGWRAQPYFDCFRRIVYRSRGRLRHSVQRSLPTGTVH